MVLRQLLVVGVVVAGCGGGARDGSFVAKWNGTINGEAVSGEKTVALTDAAQWLVQEPGSVASALPLWNTSNMGLKPRDVTDPGWPPYTVLVKELYTVPLVGKGAALGFLTRGEPVSTSIDITAVTLTGDSRNPIEVVGRYAGRINNNTQGGGRSDLEVSGTFTVYPSCAENAPTHTQFLCDAFFPDKKIGDGSVDYESQYLGESTISVPWYPAAVVPQPGPCPDGIFSTFVKGGSARFERGSLDLGAQKLSCTGHFCTGKASGVSAGGCTWDVTAIAEVGAAKLTKPDSVGFPLTTQVWINATARTGCSLDATVCQAR